MPNLGKKVKSLKHIFKSSSDAKSGLSELKRKRNLNKRKNI